MIGILSNAWSVFHRHITLPEAAQAVKEICRACVLVVDIDLGALAEDLYDALGERPQIGNMFQLCVQTINPSVGPGFNKLQSLRVGPRYGPAA